MTEAGSRAPVISTRLHVPLVPGESVRRTRLLDKVIGQRKLTLVCAPAGSGKTMTVAEWAHAAVASGEAVAWLSIEDRDDHPYRFWSAVIAALATAVPPTAAAKINALSPPHQGLERGFVHALAEVLVAELDIDWLVMDDLHLVRDPDVLAGLDLLLGLLHEEVGVVLIGRSEPPLSLARWRAEGRMIEVRGPALAFTETEARQMFAHLGIEISDADLARIVTSTEGWAVGLRLAAVSMTSSEASRAVPDISGDQREVSDYLFAEIIHQLPDGIYDFLVATCSPEQLPMELAADLSGRPDAGVVLDALCRAQALVVRSGHTSWYRYHALLRSYLLAECAKRDVTAPSRQHAVVARWFADHDEPAIALAHASQSGQDELLAALLHEHALRLVLSGQAALVVEVIGKYPNRWRHDPRVATLAALAALDIGDLAVADEWLALARAHRPVLDEHLGAQLASAIVQRALLGGDVDHAVTDSAILQVTPTGDTDVDLIVLAYRAQGRMRSGDYRGAVTDLEQALRLGRSRRYDQFVLMALSQLAGMSGTLCEFQASLDWAEQAIAFASQRGWATSPRVAYAYLLAAWTGFQTGDHEAQSTYAEYALRCLDGVNNVEVEIGVLSMSALASFEQSIGKERYEAAARFHKIWQGPNAEQISPALFSFAVPEEIRLALSVGQPSWAIEAVERAERFLPKSGDAATMRAYLLASQGKSRESVETLAPVLAGDLEVNVATTTVQANVLAACLEASLGRDQRSFAALQAALAWAAPSNYARPFLNAWRDVRPLLVANRGRFGPAEEFVWAMVQKWSSSAPSTTVVRSLLSARELEVLRDLASLLSIREIAEAQGVSVNTIKTHLRAIYTKLGVNSRSAAVRKGRLHGFI